MRQYKLLIIPKLPLKNDLHASLYEFKKKTSNVISLYYLS